MKQNKDEAKKEYEAALSVNKFDEKSECRLGAMAYDAGDLKESLSHYSEALRLQPDDVEANLGMAKVLIEMNETEKATVFAEHALQMDPASAEAHFRLSTIYRQEHRIADSKREIEQYQKYRDIKEKLRQIYHEMRVRKCVAGLRLHKMQKVARRVRERTAEPEDFLICRVGFEIDRV